MQGLSFWPFSSEGGDMQGLSFWPFSSEGGGMQGLSFWPFSSEGGVTPSAVRPSTMLCRQLTVSCYTHGVWVFFRLVKCQTFSGT